LSHIHPGLGINVVLKHTDKISLNKYITSLQNIGAEWIRLELNFYNPIEDNVLDYFISEINKKGIKVLGLLTGLVPGTVLNCIYPALKFKNPLDDIENYLKFVSYHVTKYKSNIQYWEIWNEANTLRFWINKPDPKSYFDLVKQTSPLIKTLSPNSTILMGGIMSNDLKLYAPFQKVFFIRECLELGIDEFIDIYNFHPYIPSCYYSMKDIEFYKKEIKITIDGYLNEYSDITKPSWISEFGICPLWVKIGLAEIGILYKEFYEFSRQREIPFFIWTLTDFIDKEYSRFNPETAFGLYDYDLNPKEIVNSFNKSFE
jgi:hypothetical protein